MELKKLTVKEPITREEFFEIFKDTKIESVDDYNLSLFNDYIIASVHLPYVMDNLPNFDYTLNLGDKTQVVECKIYMDKFLDYNAFIYSYGSKDSMGIAISLKEEDCDDKYEFENMNSMGLHHYRTRRKYPYNNWSVNKVMSKAIEYSNPYSLIFNHFTCSILQDVIRTFQSTYKVGFEFREIHQHPHFEPIDMMGMTFMEDVYFKLNGKLNCFNRYSLGCTLAGMDNVWTGHQHEYIKRVRKEVFELLKD